MVGEMMRAVWERLDYAGEWLDEARELLEDQDMPDAEFVSAEARADLREAVERAKAAVGDVQNAVARWQRIAASQITEADR